MARAAVAVLLALAAAANAARLTWSGCDTNFRNVMNWKTNASLPWVPEGETPVTTVFFANEDDTPFNPVNSFVQAGKYEMHELVFPDNGILTLSADGTEMIFYDRDDTNGEKAHFIAGQPERMKDDSCNFKCHKPWTLGAGTLSERPSDDPPCQDDTAIFPPESTYRVLAQGVINVKELVFEGAAVASKNDIPEYQMTPAGNELKLFLNDNLNCFEDGLVDADDNCLCHSQCADEERHREQDKELRDLVKQQAEKARKAAMERTPRLFEGLFIVTQILQDMGFSESGEDEVNCLFATPEKVDALKAALTEAIETKIVGATVHSLEVEKGATLNHISVSGNVTASLAAVSSVQPDGSLGDEWWEDDFTVQEEPVDGNMLAVHLWHAILAQAADCAAADAQAEWDQVMAACIAALNEKACQALHLLVANTATPAVTFEALLVEAQEYIANPPTEVNADNETVTLPFTPTLDNFDTTSPNDVIAAAQTTQEELAAGTPAANLTHHAMALADALQELADAEAEGDQLPQAKLVLGTHRVEMIVGRLLPQSDINRMVDERNRGPLAAHIAKHLPGNPPILAMDADRVSFKIVNEQFPADDVPDRRRRSNEADTSSSGQAHSPLLVDYFYDMLTSTDCVEGDTRAVCRMIPTSGTYHSIQGALDDIVSLYTIVTAKCYDLEKGNNKECAINEALKEIQKNPNLTPAEREQLIRDTLADVLDCPSGDCAADPDSQSYINELINTAASETERRASSSDSSAGVPIAAVAGAAAGVVLLVIIIIVVMRRRNRDDEPRPAKTAVGGASDRTVVAFENPMYDDPAQAPTAIYDDATGGIGDGEDEGLYDEPAFNADKAKENPMYQSTEDITGGNMDGGDDEGGYLDVAPDEEDE